MEELRLPPAPDEAQLQRAKEREAAIEQAKEKTLKEMEWLAKECEEAQQARQQTASPPAAHEEMPDAYGYRPVIRPLNRAPHLLPATRETTQPMPRAR